MQYVNTVISRGQEKKGDRTPSLSQCCRPGGGALFEDPDPFFLVSISGCVCESGGVKGGMSHLSIVGHVQELGAPFSPSLEFFLIRSPNQK